MAGLFFCLAPAEGAGLLFLSCYNTAKYKRLQCALCCQCSYTAHNAKRHTGLYRGVPCYFAAFYRCCVAGASCYAVQLAPRWTLHSSAQPPIIIRYIRVQGCSIAQTTAPAEGSASQPVQGQPGGWRSGTGSAIMAGGLASSTRRSSLATGGAELSAATAAYLFGLSPDSQ